MKSRKGYIDAILFRNKKLRDESIKLGSKHWSIKSDLNYAQNNLQHAKDKVIYKVDNQRNNSVAFQNINHIDRKVFDQNQKLQMVPKAYKKVDGGIAENKSSTALEGVTNTGTKEITNFTTNAKVKAEVLIPTKQKVYSLNPKGPSGKPQIQITNKINDKLNVNDEYVNTLRSNIDHLKKHFPGAKGLWKQ